MSAVFPADAFQGDAFQVGIGLVAQGLGLEVHRPVVDYVYAGGWHPAIEFRRRIAEITARRETKREKSELREMMEIYAQWKKAA